jgi:hypothetical protein
MNTRRFPSSLEACWGTAIGVAVLVVTGTGIARAPTAEELLAAVQVSRSQITDLEVECTTSHPQMHDFRRIAFENNKFLMEKEYSQFGMDQDTLFFVACAYNGELLVNYFQINGTASVNPKPDLSQVPHYDTLGSGVFDLMMYHPSAATKSQELTTADLVWVLDNLEVTILDDSETVNGFNCNVVRCFDDGNLKVELWIDPQHSYLPIRQRHYRNDGTVAVLYEIENVHEAAAGLWFPVKGRRESEAFDHPGFPDLAEAHTYAIEVDEDASGSPKLLVNQGVEDALFNYLNALPAGTLVGNVSTHETWKVGQVDDETQVVLASAQGPGVAGSFSTVRLLLCAGIGVGAGCCLIILPRLRRPQRVPAQKAS